MRWLVVLIAFPAIALAKPKVAVAPLDGDDDDKVTLAVAEAANEHAKVTGPAKVKREMDDLGVSALNSKGLKKLRGKLEVDVVIHGKLEKDGKKQKLALVLSGKGKTKATLDLEFKTTKALKKELGKELGKKLDVASGAGNDDDSDDDDAPAAKPFGDTPRTESDDKPRHKDDEDKPRHKDDEDKPRHKDDEDKPKHADTDDRPKHKDDDDRGKKRVASEDVRKRSDDDSGERHRKHRGDDEGGEPSRHPMTQAAVWLHGGAGAARRTLTYDASGAGQPPGVGTADFAGRIAGDIYPGSFSTMSGIGAAIGVFGSFSKTFGLSIKVPGSATSAEIDEAAYEVGARYRIRIGQSSLAFGASYWHRHYIAGGLMQRDQLDMPDTDFSAVAPGAIARFPVSPTMGAFASLEVPLLFSSGPITGANGFGKGTGLAFDANGGLQISVAQHYAVQIAAQFEQVGLSFIASVRGVKAATDRSMGIAATLGVYY